MIMRPPFQRERDRDRKKTNKKNLFAPPSHTLHMFIQITKKAQTLERGFIYCAIVPSRQDKVPQPIQKITALLSIESQKNISRALSACLSFFHAEWDSNGELDQRQLHQNDSLGRLIPATSVPYDVWKGYLERQQLREDSIITSGLNFLNSWEIHLPTLT